MADPQKSASSASRPQNSTTSETVTIRRSPRFLRFFILGLIVGVIAALILTFVAMAAYEAAEMFLLEVSRGPSLWLAVPMHSLQVAVILAAAWVVLRALRRQAAHEEALARAVESVLFAREQERRRISYELHDAVSPLIVSAKQHAETSRDARDHDAPRRGTCT